MTRNPDPAGAGPGPGDRDYHDIIESVNFEHHPYAESCDVVNLKKLLEWWSKTGGQKLYKMPSESILPVSLFMFLATCWISHSIENDKFYVYTLPEAINKHCIAQFSKYNWISDMGFEKWPPSRDDFHLNWMFAIEVCLIATVSLPSKLL